MTFDAIFIPAELRDAVSDEAWLTAMLDAERALTNAEALAGVVPTHLAYPITEACRPDLYDIGQLAAEGHATANPAEPLVRALRAAVGGEAAQYVHWGATSQDIVDTAAMLVARDALQFVLVDLEHVAEECARLAKEHRATPMAARTLLQQAVPTTFGLKAAGWLVAVLDARARLVQIRETRLAAQLGGAAGTLAALGEQGPEVSRLYAAELGLPEAPLPWHNARGRIAELGAALAEAAGVLAKIGLDIALLAQTEVGEVREPAGSGGSSTMPQKRNPIGSVIAGACARQARAAAGLLTESLVQEHERGVGSWQAEWGALSIALGAAGGAAAAITETLSGLDVDTARMRANLEANADGLMSERLLFLLAPKIGRDAALELLQTTPRGELLASPPEGVTAVEIEAAFDPATYLGSSALFIDRALALYDKELH
jgi:3-carboxy-cis,cis-muconate cycloisomerase